MNNPSGIVHGEMDERIGPDDLNPYGCAIRQATIREKNPNGGCYEIRSK